MAKKQRRAVNDHEEILAAYAKHSISNFSTFHPNQWGNGREPADIVILIGKAVFLINATRGKSYFENLCQHNIKQAIDRIAEWKAGRPISGANLKRSFHIPWSDVNVIAIISVVDGPHARCLNHGVPEGDFDGKVKLCCTLTSNIMLEIARNGGGGRDLITICNSIKNLGVLRERDVLDRINTWVSHLSFGPMSLPQPNRLGRAIINGVEVSAFHEYRHSFESARRQEIDGIEVFSDLSWREIYPTIGFIIQIIAQCEWKSEGVLAVSIFGESVKFCVIVSSNQAGLISKLGDIKKITDSNDCVFMYTVSLTGIGPSTVIGVLKSPEVTATEQDLLNLQ